MPRGAAGDTNDPRERRDILPRPSSHERGAALRHVLTKMQQDLEKYVKELRAKARLERKLDRIRAARERAEAAATELPEPKRRPVKHKKEGSKKNP